MRCTRANPQLQLYIDHQLTLKQTRALEAHISVCSTCHAELNLLEEVACGLNVLKVVPEPANMHEQIMRKVALSAVRTQHERRAREERRVRRASLRPSFSEILAAAVLATVATFAILLQQPYLHSLLPGVTSNDLVSHLYLQTVHLLTGIDTSMLILFIWIVGTILGICITLAAAGAEMRTHWFKAVIEHLPVR
jgi:hypothetical protein